MSKIIKNWKGKEWNPFLHPHLPRLYKQPQTFHISEDDFCGIINYRGYSHYVKDWFNTMNSCCTHNFQVMTYLHEMLVRFQQIRYTSNIQLGIPIKGKNDLEMVKQLHLTDAKTKFVVCEAQVSSIPEFEKLDFIVVDEPLLESSWHYDMQEECVMAGVGIFPQKVNKDNYLME